MTAYTTTTVGRVRWWVDSDRSELWRPLLEPLLRDPDRALAGWARFARPGAGRKGFYHVRPEPDAPGLFIKAFGPPHGSFGWIRQRIRSRARREATVARSIARRGVPAAAPVVVGEERHAGRLVRSFSVIPEVPARDLRALLEDPSTTPARRRQLVQAFGAFNRRLHDAGIDQDDSSPNNFLVDEAGAFVLIDFERCRVRARLRPSRRWHLLAKLHRHGLGVSRSDRLRFLHAYLGTASSTQARRAWSAIERRLRAVRRHDARRAARNAFEVGRQLDRQGDTWVVRGREQVPVIPFDLPRHEARTVWVLSHQLERLRLPALRPVRLRTSGVDLMRPEPEPTASGTEGPLSARAIARARRELERHGRWRHEPEWEATSAGAALRDLRAFELRLRSR